MGGITQLNNYLEEKVSNERIAVFPNLFSANFR